MWIAVVPAYNEGNAICQVIDSLHRAPIDIIIVIANGCTDNTCELAVRSALSKPLYILSFSKPLGVDIPRSIGAAFTRYFNPTGVLFMDGDMKGDIAHVLQNLQAGIASGLDMALTNCYPYIYECSDLAESVLHAREKLNRRLGFFNQLGLATPSHGPHALSARFLQHVPAKSLAIPPLTLVTAAIHNFSVGVSASIPHTLLGSKSRDQQHSIKIAHTIINDCELALSFWGGQPLDEIFFTQRLNNLAGRRFDILDQFLKILSSSEIQTNGTVS